jgi:hypothetical protein
LIWLLHGRPVTALIADAAVIATSDSGRLTFYRRAACADAAVIATSDSGRLTFYRRAAL